MKPFQIFRTGRHTPMNGPAIDFAEDVLSGIAANYDPSAHEAPIVVGHPKTNGPAYGWIAGLHMEGNRLVATPKDVDADFAEMVQKGRFKKVSASFYKPNSPGNPTPGSYQLRHVGFLGAQPPALKGLKEIEFSEADDVVTVEFGDWSLSDVAGSMARFAQRFRDWLIADKGLEQADEILPSWEIESLQRQSIRAEPAMSSFTEPAPVPERIDMTTTAQPDAAEIQRRADELTRREADFADREAAARKKADDAFVQGIVAAGTLPLALAATASALFAELDDDVLSFGEGEEAQTTTPRAALRDLLSKWPKPVTEGEIAAGGDDAPDFSDPAAAADLIVGEMQAAAEKGETISPAVAAGRLKQRAAK